MMLDVVSEYQCWDLEVYEHDDVTVLVCAVEITDDVYS